MAPAPISPINVGHIDDVQELRKLKPNMIPERFIREIQERPTPTTSLLSSSDIPTIDLSKLMKGDTDEILQLASACEEWGFFQVKLMHPPFFFSFSVKALKQAMETNALVIY